MNQINEYSEFTRFESSFLSCIECDNPIAYYASLDLSVNNRDESLFSTREQCQNIAFVNEIYQSYSCQCKVQDIACDKCGNIVGYRIAQPCLKCYNGENNGNMIIFFPVSVKEEPNDEHIAEIRYTNYDYQADR